MHGELGLSFDLDGERITRCEFQVGFMHRADEKLLEVRSYRQGLSHINRHQWMSPAAPETAFAQCCEELMGLAVPPRANALRSLVCEMQIVTGVLLRVIGIAQSISQPWRELLLIRERWLEAHEQLTGVRMHSSFVRLGGVAHDCSEVTLRSIVELAEQDFDIDLDFDLLSGIGVINQIDGAQRLATDIDRIHHSIQNIRIITQQLSHLSGPIETTLPKVVRVPVGSSYKEIEAGNGITGVWLHSDGATTPMRVHLNTPSFRHLQNISTAAVGQTSRDLWAMLLTVPLALGEIDR
jgi:NADH-quinone oxidoreductase subunit D